MTAHDTARLALACLDLTSLNDSDTEADIAQLCRRAQGPHGAVAAVCVWPRLAAFARAQLPVGIAVAAVANLPDGSADVERALRDTGAIVDAGAQEVDVVLPWRALLAGDAGTAAALLAEVRRACRGLKLKVILESGEPPSAAVIEQTSRIALDTGATPEAARVMLDAIAADRSSRAGFKASGGVRTVADAAVYIGLVAERLGAEAVVPARFRIGASGLRADIEATLASGVPAMARSNDH